MPLIRASDIGFFGDFFEDFSVMLRCADHP
jgi:hypothetical protein